MIGLRNTIAIIVFLIVLGWAMASAKAQGQTKPVPLAICDVFGRYCDQALRVSWCESRWLTTARNGQYRGLFQVSRHWRQAIPGWGPSADAQALHAFRIFKRTGWQPWECKP